MLGGSRINDTGFLQLFDNKYREYFSVIHRNGSADIKSTRLDRDEVMFRSAVNTEGQWIFEVADQTTNMDQQMDQQ